MKVKQDGTRMDEDGNVDNDNGALLRPASIVVLPEAGQQATVVTGDDARGIPTPKHIQKAVVGNTDNTFVFGNDWGLKFGLENLPSYSVAKREPDYFTAWASKNQKLTIDTSRAVNNQKKLVLDFRNVGKALSFSFADNGRGGRKLTVTRNVHLPPRTPGPYKLITGFVKQLKDSGVALPDDVVTLTTALGRMLESYMPSSIWPD